MDMVLNEPNRDLIIEVAESFTFRAAIITTMIQSS